MDFWNDFIYFFSFQDSNINNVLLGTSVLGFSCGIVGILLVLSKKALIVDAISHAVLPGICIGFMFTGVKDPLYLSLGGIVAGAIAVYLVDWISRISRIKKDASIAIALSVLFSFGVILLNIIQHSGNSNQSGLTDFLFGKAATIIKSDLYFFGVVFSIVTITLLLFYQQFKITLFDPGFSRAIGLSERFSQSLISGLVIISTAVGIQTVGIILMSALLITPASAALFWTNNFKKAILLSGMIATLSSILGVFISFLSPDMPTGPWIIVMLSIFALFSAFISKNGIIIKKINTSVKRKKLLTENVLIAIYEMGRKTGEIKKGRPLQEIHRGYSISYKDLNRGLKILKSNEFIKFSNELFCLTDKGISRAKKIIRLSIMSELNLDRFITKESDNNNIDLEFIKQILTEQEINELMTKLDERVNDF